MSVSLFKSAGSPQFIKFRAAGAYKPAQRPFEGDFCVISRSFELRSGICLAAFSARFGSSAMFPCVSVEIFEISFFLNNFRFGMHFFAPPVFRSRFPYIVLSVLLFAA